MENSKLYTIGLYDMTVRERARQVLANVTKLNSCNYNIRLDNTILDCLNIYLIPIVSDNIIGFINKMGDVIVSPKYDEIKGQFGNKDNIVAVKQGKKWSVIDSDGRELLPFMYSYIHPSKDSTLATVQKYNGWSVIDTKADTVIVKEGEYELIEGFRFGFARVKKDGLWGVINSKGELVVPNRYYSLLDFYSNWDKPETKVKLTPEDNWTYINLETL